jgi:hypothetical protein
MHQTWSDISWLAQDFLGRTLTKSGQATAAWHHLLLVVGNFKRSAGLISPAELPETRDDFEPPAHFEVPGLSGAIATRDVADSWRALTQVPGLGVPTATTLLSALWPGYHIIIDIRDGRAAVGISAGAGWNTEDLDSSDLSPREPDEAYWKLYEWFRPLVVTTAGKSVTPAAVERALYILDTKSLPKGREWTWSQYREHAKKAL